MTSITRRLLFYSTRCPRRISPRYSTLRSVIQWQRPLSHTIPRCDEGPTGKASEGERKAASGTESNKEASNGQAEAMPQEPDEQATIFARLFEDLRDLNPEVIKEALKRGERGTLYSKGDLDKDEHFEVRGQEGRLGFWAEGEEEMGPDEDYYGDDLTSLGHAELEQHRELREYARLAVWELPLLSQFAKPFELPNASTPFRFRYTSYLGEKHPATNKVVVEFSASDMSDLTPQQKDKLIKLAGPRYNPDTGIIKMSCELFDTQAQNKRFLGDTITKLLAEARDPKETFEDVPFDFRHHKPKVRHEFPKEWILTEERKAYLKDKRKEQARLEDERIHNGRLVDGQVAIDNALPRILPTAEPVMVPAGGARKQLR
ncbi:hypothetical protein K469DRAFT_652305 [Zopfia rhizophila CBS 207.26]|uniref:Small ribosomal subunit protein mS35 mitochondrial conserved domain-containing protein n=1 Tax=Zopfia rhizophila CBS 207.26 TaxID=1314779 RepID=A0A6A6ERU0_9PEZI|nr:hypothetical protein K469DRAFT_652305 [Zopfia rhizophila CBS 207.26]